MPEIKCWISNADLDRLFALKRKEGLNDLTGNEYAEKLLHRILRQMHPNAVLRDPETGEIIK